MENRSTEQHCLVTGGAGFIGSHLTDELLRRGCHVTVVDDLSTGRLENLPVESHPGLRFIQGSVEEVLPTLTPEAYQRIYHLAAAVGVRLVIEQPVHTIRTNVIDTLRVLDFAVSAGLPTLIASTSEVYGKGTRTPFAEDDDVVYGPTTLSRWSYACSKAIDEYLALAYSRERDLPVVVTRFFNTIGPRQIGRYGMVVPRFVAGALRDEPLLVHGDGLQSRCFCDVRDVVPAIIRLLDDASCHGRVFNVGSDESITIDGLATLVRDTLGSTSEIRHVPYREVYGEGFDDLRHRQPDLTRIREAIGFAPTIPLRQTVLDIAEDVRQRLGDPAESTQ